MNELPGRVEGASEPRRASQNDDVTVIVTCFNYGAFLAESVQSALAQEDGEPRVIVVDDGSTEPDTLAALERLPSQVELVRQANAGVAAARNEALRRAQTPYVLALDADDRLAEGALRALRAALVEADPQIGFSYGLIGFFGAWEGVMKLPPYDPYRLLFRHSIGPSALVRRELFADVGGYDPTFRGYEDWELWLHALQCGWRGRRVAQVTHLYRRHGPTRHHDARAHYRAIFSQLRAKYPGLYSRAGRRRLAAQSEMGPAGRLVYRWWWGLRPLPASVELVLQSALWGRTGRKGGG
ncbi:MAG TPA: glycosyltransferase family A protein [Solirubrobacteraceae bacterium]|jgi:glycosyltransferase involved in cell wall biosynthesis|nr:glycosyltransferase family A protein [Solirubrobacteraceae bacterium]